MWKKVGIFEAIISTKCRILKNKNLRQRVVRKWCYNINTFLISFCERGGNELIFERKQLTNRNEGHTYT